VSLAAPPAAAGHCPLASLAATDLLIGVDQDCSLHDRISSFTGRHPCRPTSTLDRVDYRRRNRADPHRSNLTTCKYSSAPLEVMRTPPRLIDPTARLVVPAICTKTTPYASPCSSARASAATLKSRSRSNRHIRSMTPHQMSDSTSSQHTGVMIDGGVGPSHV
jgi:hypothetical protein